MENKTINSNGICGYCFNKTITYSIENGNYMYFCSTCCKNIFSNYVLTESEAIKQKLHNEKLIADGFCKGNQYDD